MQITETLNEGLKRELKVVIPADSLNSKLSERLQSMSKQARIKGFRPGKVPAEHLRKVYGRSVLAEIIQESVQQSAQKAVEDRGEKPALQPVINFSEDKDEIEAVMNGKADLAYTLEFEVIPQFDKPDYAKIKLEKKTTSASDADIDEALGKIVEQNQSFAPREAGAAAENGDRVTLDYSGKLDGRVFSGGTEEGAQLVLGSNTFIPGFEAQLVGKKPGDKTEVKVTFPENYQAD
ncbi:MAG: trigger factor, partial [Rhodobiaceae bacterium]|nr:trigger factor [Rhodobiaceae bacterium]